MDIKQLAASTLVLTFAISAYADDSFEIKKKLEKILTCENAATPEEVVSLIRSLGGIAIVLHNSDLSDAEYTIPTPVNIFGRPVTKISIRHGRNTYGSFNEYNSLFTGESIDTIARLANISLDAAGNYRKEVGNHDLILRSEAGATYVSCANDVRTIAKSIKRTAKGIGNTVRDATRME